MRVKTYDFRAFCRGEYVRTNWRPWWVKCLDYLEHQPQSYGRIGIMIPPHIAGFVPYSLYEPHLQEEPLPAHLEKN